MALTQAKPLMHPESDYGRMIGGLFANASAASPPAVYFAKHSPNHPPSSDQSECHGVVLK